LLNPNQLISRLLLYVCHSTTLLMEYEHRTEMALFRISNWNS